MRKSRPAGGNPGRQPVRPEVCRAVTALADSCCPGFAREAIVILVSVIGQACVRTAVGGEEDLEPGMSRVGKESGIVPTGWEKS